MLNGSGANAITYLVGTLIDLYIAAVLLRLLLQWTRADFYNPLSQFLVKLTNPALVPMRRVIPPIRRLDTASVVLMLLLEVTGAWMIGIIGGSVMTWPQILAYSAIKLLMTLLMTYFFLIIIAVILSWLARGMRHPFIPLVFQLTEPILKPIRKVIPPIAGIDLSPLFALIAIRFLILLLPW
ncbi:MAG TPA: YggT family protein [Xanthomonadales bacterium]|nr:YggT family protein [Xanthomonadales bacterium]